MSVGLTSRVVADIGADGSAFTAAVNSESFAASCPLPENADSSTAHAQLADGVLRVIMRSKTPQA